MKTRYLIIGLALLLTACDRVEESRQKETLRGRHIDIPVYAYHRPDGWSLHFPEKWEDTTQAICEFHIEESKGKVRITFHNFPTESIGERIPPEAQIQRWKNQLRNPEECRVELDGWGGFWGYRFEGPGVLGWAMQMAPEHYYALSTPAPDERMAIYKEMRADFTIKAVAPVELLDKHRAEITAFANSIELLEEIPNR